MKKVDVKKEEKIVSYLLNLSEKQHFALKLKALNNRTTIKNLIINTLINKP